MLTLIFGLLFTGAALYNLTQGDIPNAIVGSIIGGLMLGIAGFASQQKKSSEEFLQWLVQHREHLEQGGMLTWQGMPVTRDSEVTRYQLIASFLILSTRSQSTFYLKGQDRQSWAAALCSLGTLLLGWWSLHGIVWTPAALYRNLRGGDRIRVGTLLEAAQSPAGAA